MTIDYKRMVKDLVRGAIVDYDYIPDLMREFSPNDAHDGLMQMPTGEEFDAFYEIVREVQKEHDTIMGKRINFDPFDEFFKEHLGEELPCSPKS